MKQKIKRFCLVMKQAVTVALLFVFLTGVSFAGVAEDLAGGKSLQAVIDDNLLRGITVDNLVKDLVAADEYGKDIICGLFNGEAEKSEVIKTALDVGMETTDVVNWSYQCGASREDVQQGFSIAGESLPPGIVFRQTGKIEENSKEYLYNPPSPSK